MQMHFYILPGSDIAAIKKDAFRDMGEKLKLWKHYLKNKLKIQSGDTPATVRARVRYILQKYEPEDVDKLLDIWCDVGNQVGQYFNCNNVLLVIVIV
jgi:hypothetical protein